MSWDQWRKCYCVVARSRRQRRLRVGKCYRSKNVAKKAARREGMVVRNGSCLPREITRSRR